MSIQAINSRDVAFEVLIGVSRDDAYANLLLPQRIAQAGLDSKDSALATELTYGTLRMQGLYDAIIGQCSTRGIAQIDLKTLIVLRLGAHQLLSMRVPEHAALNETVNLAKKWAGKSTSGFVNAVLRKILTHSLSEWISAVTSDQDSEAEKFAIRYSHPAWIVRAFESALEAQGRVGELENLLESDNANPQVTYISLPSFKLPAPQEAIATKYSPYGFSLPHGGDPSKIPGVLEGHVRVQDEGSQLAALALVGVQEVRHGEKWLDMCAGPGGKAALLASLASENDCSLVANEIGEARAGLVEQALRPFANVQVTCSDGTQFPAQSDRQFDRVLVDAPCSGLGALRRRPEARWRKQPSDIGILTALQEKLLLSAIAVTKPGGIVAYVTCSPHLAETRGIVNSVLKKVSHLHELDTAAALSKIVHTPLDSDSSRDKSMQLWPHIHGTDAMFISLLRVEQ